MTSAATGAEEDLLARGSDTAVRATVASLRAAQPVWESLGVTGRVRHVRALRDWLLDHEDELTDLIQHETGKSRVEASIEVPVMCEGINYFTRHASRFLSDVRVRPSGPLSLHKRARSMHRPYPVIGVIAPWNFPLSTPGLDSVTALLTGCAVALKPSELTPSSGLALGRAWNEIDAPPVLAVLPGAGDVGEALVDSADYIQFTGSTATGREVAVRAARRLIPTSLELGGKDAALVLADADLDRAAAGIAWGGMFNAGQVCTSIERVYVEDAVHDDFVTRLVGEVGKLRTGSGPDRATHEVGSLTSRAQRDVVAAHVESSAQAGATALTPGHSRSDGLFHPPTVLLDVEQTHVCVTEETFGPTLPVIRVRDAAEAVRFANDSRYGLSASIWTRDVRRGLEIARRLDVGAVNINDAIVNSYIYSLPQGGWKESGLGARFGGAQGLLKYTRTTAVTIPRRPVLAREPGWYPYDEKRTRRTRRLTRLAVARGRRRFSSTPKGKA